MSKVPQVGKDFTKDFFITEFKKIGLLKDNNIKSIQVKELPKNLGVWSELYRIFFTYEKPTTTEPSQVIAKVPPEAEDRKEKGVGMGLYNTEHLCYTNFLIGKDYAPKLYFTLVDEKEKKFLIVMEDLSLRKGDFCLKDGYTLDHIKKAITALSLLHAQTWGIDAKKAKKDLPWLGDSTSFHANLKGFYDNATKPLQAQLEKGKLTFHKDLLRVLEEFRTNFSGVCQYLEKNLFNSLIHWDPRPDNIFIKEDDGKVILIDWQLVMRSNPLYDIVVLMIEFLTKEPLRTKKNQEEVLKFYHGELAKFGLKVKYEDIVHNFRASIILYSFKVLYGLALICDFEKNDRMTNVIVGFARSLEEIILLNDVVSWIDKTFKK